MNTIQTKGSCKRVNQFLKEGGTLFNNSFDNMVFKLYYRYLVNINNKENTILTKLRFIYLLEQYFISIGKSFKTFTKENVYDYFNECSKLSWGYPQQDINKLDIKNFCLFSTKVLL